MTEGKRTQARSSKDGVVWVVVVVVVPVAASGSNVDAAGLFSAGVRKAQ
jgi:hypothetical protein